MKALSIKVNNKKYLLEINEADSLQKTLRSKLGLLGVKEGCNEGYCGACTVIMDGKAVNSCQVLAIEADNKEVFTIEGVADRDDWALLQELIVSYGAVQCGYCTPGTVLTAISVIEKFPDIADNRLKRALAGNLCRCGTYPKTLEAILAYRDQMKKGDYGTYKRRGIISEKHNEKGLVKEDNGGGFQY